MYGLGFLLFLCGAGTVYKKYPPRIISKPLELLSARLAISHTQALYLILSIACGIIASLASGDWLVMRILPLAIGAWILGICLVVLGTTQYSSPPLHIPTHAKRWAIILIVISFVLRGVNTSGYPISLSGDEASSGLSALGFTKGEVNNIFGVGWFSFPAFYFYIQSLSIAVLGQTTAALRLPSALVGSLTVGAVYLFGRRMFNHFTGLLSGIFLAAFHFHIHFSRIGLNNIWDGFWYVVVLGLTWEAWLKESRRHFIAAGLALGFSQYFYVSVRLLFAFIPVWLILAGWSNRTRLKNNLIHIALMFFTAAVVVFPMAWYFSMHMDQFAAPFNRVTIFSSWMEREMANSGWPVWRVTLMQLWKSGRGFTHEPLTMWYTPGTAMLLPAGASFFLVGLALMLFHLRSPRTALIFMWLLFFTVMGGFSQNAPTAQRLVAAAPVAAWVVGFSLAEIAALFSQVWKKQSNAFTVLAMGSMLVMAAVNLNFYFLEFSPKGNFGGANTTVAQRIADHLQDKKAAWQVIFFGYPRMGYYSIRSTEYLAPHISGLDFNHPWGSVENPTPESEQLIFVLLPNHLSDLIAIRASYPGGVLGLEYEMNGELLYWYYEIAP